EDEITPELGAVDDVLHRVDRGHGRLRGGAEGFVARRRALERALGLGDAPRINFDATEREPRLGNLAALEAIEAERGGERKISRAPAELVEAAAGIGGQQRQARLDQKLVVAQRGRHDPLEEIARRDDALAARAFGDDLAVESRKHQAPFRGRIGMRQAAAERAPIADRIMRDVMHHGRQQFADRPVTGWPSGPRQPGRWNAAWRTQAPMTSLPPATAMRLSASTPLISTRCAGLASRKAMVGTRLWPPARTRPSSAANSASSATASS